MSGLRRKPLPDELKRRYGATQVLFLPPPELRLPHMTNSGAGEAVTEDQARVIAREAAKAGSTRRFIARLMRDAGYEVAAADLNPPDNRRRWTE
jgi:hypothetical protein